jgi:hypothetical protein
MKNPPCPDSGCPSGYVQMTQNGYFCTNCGHSWSGTNPKNVLQILSERVAKSPKIIEMYKDERIKFLEKRLECIEEAINDECDSSLFNDIMYKCNELLEEYENKS